MNFDLFMAKIQVYFFPVPYKMCGLKTQSSRPPYSFAKCRLGWLSNRQ